MNTTCDCLISVESKHEAIKRLQNCLPEDSGVSVSSETANDETTTNTDDIQIIDGLFLRVFYLLFVVKHFRAKLVCGKVQK